MPSKQPLLNGGNFYIMINALFGLLPLLLIPYIMLSFCILIIVLFDHLEKAGGAVAVLGTIYTFVQEFFAPDAHAMAQEIRNYPSMLRLRQQPDSAKPMRLCDAVLSFSENSHRFVVRFVETLMVAGGGTLALFGKEIATSFSWVGAN